MTCVDLLITRRRNECRSRRVNANSWLFLPDRLKEILFLLVFLLIFLFSLSMKHQLVTKEQKEWQMKSFLTEQVFFKIILNILTTIVKKQSEYHWSISIINNIVEKWRFHSILYLEDKKRWSNMFFTGVSSLICDLFWFHNTWRSNRHEFVRNDSCCSTWWDDRLWSLKIPSAVSLSSSSSWSSWLDSLSFPLLSCLPFSL